MTYRKFETVLMHIVAAAAILFAIWIAMTPTKVRAEPRCHTHHGVAHCH